MPGAQPGQSYVCSQDTHTTYLCEPLLLSLTKAIPAEVSRSKTITFDYEMCDREVFVGLDLWDLGAEEAEVESFPWMEKKKKKNAEFMDYILSQQPLPLLQANLAKPCLFLPIIN